MLNSPDRPRELWYRQAYPRPDFDRHAASKETGFKQERLNGLWKLTLDRDDVGLKEKWYNQIGMTLSSETSCIVPFAPQTEASKWKHGVSDVMWYKRHLGIPLKPESGYRTILHFGAVDYECSVWIQGKFVGSHRGGHVPFEFDITDFVDGDEKGMLFLTVRVVDKIKDLTQPRGKQYWKPQSESIFYRPTSGIWQPVWVETIPQSHIDRAVLNTDIDRGVLTLNLELKGIHHLRHPSVRASAKLGPVNVASSQKELHQQADEATLSVNMALPGFHPPESFLDTLKKPGSTILPTQISGDAWVNGIGLWSPEHPILYDVDLELFDGSKLIDSVRTYAGMRKVSWDNGQFKLNNKPYFSRLVLDQGYWPRTGLTAPDDLAFEEDISMMKQLGLNGARKHQKLEDPRYLYHADRLGFLVWSEMANAYEFSSRYQERFTEEWTAAVKRDINHPCIVAWVPVNESWAYPSLPISQPQRNFLKAIYYLTKSIDPTRPVVDNDGWEHTVTDLLTVHDYSAGEDLKITAATKEGLLAPKAKKDVLLEPDLYQQDCLPPIILSEFGGIAIDVASKDSRAQNVAGGTEDWGYHTANSQSDLLARIKSVVDAVIDGGVAQGYCYTQLADVEQETNGILTAERGFKLDVEQLRAVFSRPSKFDP